MTGAVIRAIHSGALAATLDSHARQTFVSCRWPIVPDRVLSSHQRLCFGSPVILRPDPIQKRTFMNMLLTRVRGRAKVKLTKWFIRNRGESVHDLAQ